MSEVTGGRLPPTPDSGGVGFACTSAREPTRFGQPAPIGPRASPGD